MSNMSCNNFETAIGDKQSRQYNFIICITFAAALIIISYNGISSIFIADSQHKFDTMHEMMAHDSMIPSNSLHLCINAHNFPTIMQ